MGPPGKHRVVNLGPAPAKHRRHLEESQPRPIAAGERGETKMHMRLLLAAIVVVVSGLGAGVARADMPDTSLAGKQFYFSANCTGLGDIILVNQSLARTAAFRVFGGGVVVEPLNGAPGVERVANSECTITGGGFSQDTIEPFDEPFGFPALIVGA
jgi:hypothetical protein